MQRLVRLSVEQSGTRMDIDPMSGADRSTARSVYRSILATVQICTRHI